MYQCHACFSPHVNVFTQNIVVALLLGQLTRNTSKDTEVFITDLENRARDLNIFDLSPFFGSVLFKNFRMRVDRTRGVIVKTYV